MPRYLYWLTDFTLCPQSVSNWVTVLLKLRSGRGVRRRQQLKTVILSAETFVISSFCLEVYSMPTMLLETQNCFHLAFNGIQ